MVGAAMGHRVETHRGPIRLTTTPDPKSRRTVGGALSRPTMGPDTEKQVPRSSKRILLTLRT
eukprot:7496885-Alexandrium_andersonii.AAC.1